MNKRLLVCKDFFSSSEIDLLLLSTYDEDVLVLKINSFDQKINSEDFIFQKVASSSLCAAQVKILTS